MERLYLTPGEMIAAYSAAGRRKLNRPTASLLLLGILAGAIIAVAAAATNTAAYGIADTWTLRTVCALLFPFGLGLVVVTGAELFTGNCMLPITLLDGGGTVGRLLRNWALSYLCNIPGACWWRPAVRGCGQLDYSGGGWPCTPSGWRPPSAPCPSERRRPGDSTATSWCAWACWSPIRQGHRRPADGGLSCRCASLCCAALSTVSPISTTRRRPDGRRGAGVRGPGGGGGLDPLPHPGGGGRQPDSGHLGQSAGGLGVGLLLWYCHTQAEKKTAAR